jgi:methyl-accepting chemotaxis protein
MARFARLARPAVSLVIVVGVLAGTGATAGAGSSRPTPKQWAKGVCSSIQTWINDVEDTISSLGSENSLEDTINAAADGIKQATDQLGTSLDDLGLPQTAHAKQARSALDQLSSQLDHDAKQIKRSLTDLGNDPVDIASTFADIGSIVQKAVDQVQSTGDTLRGLDRSGELRKALKSSPACKSLEASV